MTETIAEPPITDDQPLVANASMPISPARVAAPPSETASRAALAGHPIHPALVPFPIAFLSAAVATDLAYMRTHDRFWSRASTMLLGAGLAAGVVAAPFGLLDFLTVPRARSAPEAWVHGGGNVMALGVAMVNLSRRLDEPERSIVPAGVVLSAATAALLAVTGWLGGGLAYRRGVGVSAEVTESSGG